MASPCFGPICYQQSEFESNGDQLLLTVEKLLQKGLSVATAGLKSDARTLSRAELSNRVCMFYPNELVSVKRKNNELMKIGG